MAGARHHPHCSGVLDRVPPGDGDTPAGTDPSEPYGGRDGPGPERLRQRDGHVVTAPAAASVLLALDSGPQTGPVFTGYQILAPATSYEASRGYGWVGQAPDSRDRASLDNLRRDFTLSKASTTLRITVPAGAHRVHLLRGDAGFTSAPTVVSQDGTVVSGPGDTLAPGAFEWQSWPVDGGAAGRTVT